jgi:cystathionine beta-lyase
VAKDMNFGQLIKRKGTNSVKYDDLLSKFGKEDILPLWVADMDFATSPAIIKAIENRLKHPIFGYSFYGTEYFEAIKNWYNTRHDWEILKEQIVPVNNIASAVGVAIEIFSNIGDEVLIQTPLYPPFREAIIKHERTVSANPLVLINGRYEIDWDDFRAKAKLAKIFLFCSPHNPTGRVWRREELETMSQICHENGVIIVSDEIHSDLTHKNYKHIPIAKIAPNITITLNSPAKRFNIPSIINAYAVIKDEKLREKFSGGCAKYAPHTISPLTEGITISAYTQSKDWSEMVDIYLANNLAFIIESLKEIPKIKAITPEASFLLWLDCRALNMNNDELMNLFVNKLKLGFNNGSDFGIEGDGFMRLNYASPMSIIIEAMDRLRLIDN